ncbi:dTDP-4-dehydrorhamnose reductase [Labilithrix luteola]|uniref:dTDP-4-dehydrorhamnose reductase n=1 Tax=Labilithrix luteola TaxID=1391654 RepID=A0A0K1PM15_9BACT|nr:hypothetical protein [Labilithrix luteola]AKU94149.1 dTDP-4-dehydrorhamnose reductase [Labilithrix luteola]
MLRLPLLYGPIADWSESAVTSLVPAIVASLVGVPVSSLTGGTRLGFLLSLGLLCHATQCMDVFICEQVASETEQVAQMDGKAARTRERPTSFRKRNIADYCAEGGYV